MDQDQDREKAYGAESVCEQDVLEPKRKLTGVKVCMCAKPGARRIFVQSSSHLPVVLFQSEHSDGHLPLRSRQHRRGQYPACESSSFFLVLLTVAH